MIDEKKLLCAFIYSAYESGYCGLLLNKTTREQHKKLYREYIETEKDFPEREISQTQRTIIRLINSQGVREYIYKEHFNLVISRIIKETKISLEKIKEDPFLLRNALSCPINYYKILSRKKTEIRGKNIILGNKTTIKLLPGLERPNIGDIVSGHWSFMLEIMDQEQLKKYLPFAQKYYSQFK